MNVLDQLSNFSAAHTSSLAFQIIDRVQNARPGEQIAALGSVFLLMCEVFRIDPRTALERASRSMRDADQKQLPTTLALRDYIEKELRGC